jgi:UDP-glucose:(heptosyl)LPS alpha-1,3-glucosyltransferase
MGALQGETFDGIFNFDRTPIYGIYRAGEGCHREWLRVANQHLPMGARILRRLDPVHAFHLSMERQLFSDRLAPCVVAISQRVRKDILRHYGGSDTTGIREKNVKVIYNGVDSEEFSPADSVEERSRIRKRLGLAPDDVVVLFVGTGIFRKGFKHLLRAGAILKNRGANISILAMGRPEGQGGASKLAKRWKMEGNVRFSPAHEYPANVYRAADLFCLPSIYEPFGFACLEALASGLPCIVSRACGAAEILSEAKNGYILEEADDADTLAEHIESLFDEKVRRQMGESARTLAEKYPISKNTDQMLEVYQEVYNQTY